MAEINTVKQFVDFILQYTGLNIFKPDIFEKPRGFDSNKVFSLALIKDIKLSIGGNFKEDAEIFNDEILNSIQSSRLFTDAMEERDKTILGLKEELSEARKFIEELKPFRAHYEIEMKLRHGTEE